MNYKLIVTSILCVGLVACTKNVLKEVEPAAELEHYSLLVASETNKTALQHDGTTINWVAGDRISIVGADDNYNFVTSEGGRTALFEGKGILSSSNYLVYPYNEYASLADGVVTTELPLVQRPVALGFDPQAAICVAQYQAKTTMQMRNVFGAFKLPLTQTDVVRVDITSKGSVKIGGIVNITPSKTAPTVVAHSSTISLCKEDGSAIDAGTYYILAAPATLSSGLKVTFYYTDGGYAEKDSGTSATLNRCEVLNLVGVEKNLTRKYNTSATIDTYDFQKLASKTHPRLFLNDIDMSGVNKVAASGSNIYLTGIDKQLMDFAKKNVDNYKSINFKPYNSGLYFGDKLRLMICMAYAYRKTGETKYRDYAINNVMELCAYPNWNADPAHKNKNIQSTNPEYTPTSFLNTSDLLLATSLVYDWLYYDLTSSQRSTIKSAIKEKAYAWCKSDYNIWWWTYAGNWNQVCTGALMISALAIYTNGDTETLTILKDAFKSNNNMLDSIYGSYGAYAEGPNYWNLGTSFQVTALTALETALGTDLNLSNHTGFKKTPNYKSFAIANTKEDGCYTCFNYADCDYISHPEMEFWYFANKFNNKNLLFREVENALTPYADGDYSSFRCPPVPVYHCYKIGVFTPSVSTERLYTAQDGEIHLVIARTGWGETDKYLGLKGGKAETTHAHMDAGEFIYESQGIRWAIDYDHPDYSKMKTELEKLGEGYFDTKQTSLRYQLITINNRAHNCLTVNNKDHCVSGSATYSASYDSSSELGGKLTTTPVYFNDLQSALRKAVIKNGDYLEITDKITAKSGSAAHVRFSLLTKATVNILSDGIKLTQGGKSVKLTVTGCTPTYKKWSTDPSSSDWPSGKTRSFEDPLDANLCGFEYDIAAGATVSAVTTIKDL